ncbi:MAG TPA: methyltransferase domain-containing protein [Verrucomicrobiae bacterium]|nr:methyltransferase domain-containing protein [Verrucomicrobiae bacterium]
MRNRTRHLTALTLLILFPAGFFQPPAASADIAEPAPVFISSSSPITLPAELGSIQSQYLQDKPGPFVVFIQDAHAVNSAQEHIRKLIGYFQKNYGIRLAALEGAKGKIDVTLLRSFPDAFVKEQAMKKYLDRGELTGAQLAAVLNPDGMEYYGIEDWPLYEDNYFAYLRAEQNEKKILERLAAAEKEFDARRKTAFTPELNAFFERQSAFYDEKKDLLELLSFLNGLDPAPLGFGAGAMHEAVRPFYPQLAALMESLSSGEDLTSGSLDAAIKQMARAFLARHAEKLPKPDQLALQAKFQDYLTGALDAGAFLNVLLENGQKLGLKPRLTPAMKRLAGRAETLSMIRGTRLFDELEAFLGTVESSLAPGQEQQELLKQYARLRVMKDLARMELVRRQLNDYQKEPEEYLKLLGDDRAEIYPALEFYRLAMRRDSAFHQNLQRLMREKKSKSAIVLAGGFHADGFEEALKNAGISYVTVTPKIDSIQGHEHYGELMKGGLSYKALIKTTLYDAFMKHASSELVAPLEKPDFKRDVKIWRDEVIRTLAREGRTAEAGRYTAYVDRLAEVYAKKFESQLDGGENRDSLLAALGKELARYQKESLDKIRDEFEKKFSVLNKTFTALAGKGQMTPQAAAQALEKVCGGQPSALQTVVVAATDPSVDFKGFVTYVTTDRLPEQALQIDAAPEFVLPPAAPGTYQSIAGDFASGQAISADARMAVERAAGPVVRQMQVAETQGEIAVGRAAAEQSFTELVGRAAESLPEGVKAELREKGAFTAIADEIKRQMAGEKALRNELRAEPGDPSDEDAAFDILKSIPDPVPEKPKPAVQPPALPKAEPVPAAPSEAEIERMAAEALKDPAEKPKAAGTPKNMVAIQRPELPRWLAGSRAFAEKHAQIMARLTPMMDYIDQLLEAEKTQGPAVQEQVKQHRQQISVFWLQSIGDDKGDAKRAAAQGLIAAIEEQTLYVRNALSHVTQREERMKIIRPVARYLVELGKAVVWLRRGQLVYTPQSIFDQLSKDEQQQFLYQLRRLEGTSSEKGWDLAEENYFQKASVKGKIEFLLRGLKFEYEGYPQEQPEEPEDTGKTQVPGASKTVAPDASKTAVPGAGLTQSPVGDKTQVPGKAPADQGAYELTTGPAADDQGAYELTTGPAADDQGPYELTTEPPAVDDQGAYELTTEPPAEEDHGQYDLTTSPDEGAYELTTGPAEGEHELTLDSGAAAPAPLETAEPIVVQPIEIDQYGLVINRKRGEPPKAELRAQEPEALVAAYREAQTQYLRYRESLASRKASFDGLFDQAEAAVQRYQEAFRIHLLVQSDAPAHAAALEAYRSEVQRLTAEINAAQKAYFQELDQAFKTEDDVYRAWEATDKALRQAVDAGYPADKGTPLIEEIKRLDTEASQFGDELSRLREQKNAVSMRARATISKWDQAAVEDEVLVSLFHAAAADRETYGRFVVGAEGWVLAGKENTAERLRQLVIAEPSTSSRSDVMVMLIAQSVLTHALEDQGENKVLGLLEEISKWDAATISRFINHTHQDLLDGPLSKGPVVRIINDGIAGLFKKAETVSEKLFLLHVLGRNSRKEDEPFFNQAADDTDAPTQVRLLALGYLAAAGMLDSAKFEERFGALAERARGEITASKKTAAVRAHESQVPLVFAVRADAVALTLSMQVHFARQGLAIYEEPTLRLLFRNAVAVAGIIEKGWAQQAYSDFQTSRAMLESRSRAFLFLIFGHESVHPAVSRRIGLGSSSDYLSVDDAVHELLADLGTYSAGEILGKTIGEFDEFHDFAGTEVHKEHEKTGDLSNPLEGHGLARRVIAAFLRDHAGETIAWSRVLHQALIEAQGRLSEIKALAGSAAPEREVFLRSILENALAASRAELRAEASDADRGEQKTPVPDVEAIRDFHTKAATNPGGRVRVSETETRKVRISLTKYREYLQRIAEEFTALRNLYFPGPAVPEMLSIGPGEGAAEIALHKHGIFRVDGMELTDALADKLNENASAQGVHIPLQRGDANELLDRLPAESRDVIYIGEAIGYFEMQKLFPKLMRVLRPGGIVVITTYPVPKGEENVKTGTEFIRYPVRTIQRELKRAGLKNDRLINIRPGDFPESTPLRQDYERHGRDIVVHALIASKPRTWNGMWEGWMNRLFQSWQPLEAPQLIESKLHPELRTAQEPAPAIQAPAKNGHENLAPKTELRSKPEVPTASSLPEAAAAGPDITKLLPEPGVIAERYTADAAHAADSLREDARQELRGIESAWTDFNRSLTARFSAVESVREIVSGIYSLDLENTIRESLGPDTAAWVDVPYLAGLLRAAVAREFLGLEEAGIQALESTRLSPAARAMFLKAGKIPVEVWNAAFRELAQDPYPRSPEQLLFDPRSFQNAPPFVFDAAFLPLPSEPGFAETQRAFEELVSRGITVSIPFDKNGPHAATARAFASRLGAASIFLRPYADGRLDLSPLSRIQFGNGYYGVFKQGVQLVVPKVQGDLSERSFFAQEWFARSEALGGGSGFLEMSLKVLASPYLKGFLEKSTGHDPRVMSERAFNFLVNFFNDIANTRAIQNLVKSAA